MYKKYLVKKKNFFFILKKFYHKNKYLNLFYFNILKRIFLKKNKFFNLKCTLITNFTNNFFNYFFLKEKILFLKYNIFNLIFLNYNNIYIILFLKQSFLYLKIYNIFKIEFFFNFSKIFIFLYNEKNIIFFFLKFNHLIKKNFLLKKKNVIYNYIYILYKKNFFIYFINIKIFNIYFYFSNKIKIYEKNNFVIENFILKKMFSFSLIYNRLYVKKKIKNIFVYQNAEFFLNKKNFSIINLNINLYTKKIFCKHKISFYFFKNNNFYFIKKNLINKI
ncbi:hypothetical protein [Candidatus Carsonella ruddii]|uniref:hypothetical protein n=1 Tax=Carsonella ruddii TaxID=114186 RepID=UPI003D9A1468